MPTELKILRVKKGLNQGELAEKLGVTRNTISSWENGKLPSLKNANKLADFFGVSVLDIFFTKNNN